MNQYFYINEIVKGAYYGRSFTGVIKKRECVNNGHNPAYAYHIELYSPIETTFGMVNSICWIDRDQLKSDLSNQLELMGQLC